MVRGWSVGKEGVHERDTSKRTGSERSFRPVLEMLERALSCSGAVSSASTQSDEG